MGWIMFRELGWKVFRCLKEPLRLRMGMRRWPDKSTWNSRSPLRRIFSLLMCSLVMPDVMKGMRMLLGISTTSSLPVYWYTTRMIKCNMTVMTMVFSIRRNTEFAICMRAVPVGRIRNTMISPTRIGFI